MTRKRKYWGNIYKDPTEVTFKSRKGTVIKTYICEGKREFTVYPNIKNSENWNIYEPDSEFLGNCFAELNNAYRDLLSYGDKQAWRWLIRHVRELEVPGRKKLKDFLIGGTFVDVDALIEYSGDTYNYPYAPRWGRRRI